MNHSIFNGLNDSIKAYAKRMKLGPYVVSDFAPQTYADLIKSYNETGKIIVWSGDSDKTIYGSPDINWLFRAIPDTMHIRLNAEFTFQDESRLAIFQSSQVGTELSKIIQIEIIGQAQHYYETGSFPDNQILFTLQKLKALK